MKNDISSTAIVPSAIKVDYRAGTEVALQPGFHAQPGSSFHAFIHGCDAPGNSFKSTVLQNHESGGTGIDRRSESQVLLYPNPVLDGTFRVKLMEMEHCITGILLSDALGRSVQSTWRVESCDRVLVALSRETPSTLLIARVTLSDGSVLTRPINLLR